MTIRKLMSHSKLTALDSAAPLAYHSPPNQRWRISCQNITHMKTYLAFEVTSKRRKGFPSETRVKRGMRTIRGGEVELNEKLGRNDLCPCLPLRTVISRNAA